MWYRPNPKTGASAARYAIYSKAATIEKALSLNDPDFARKNLYNNLRKGLSRSTPSSRGTSRS